MHKTFKTSAKSWISIEKRVNKFNQEAYFKSWIDINTELKKKKCKTRFRKRFLQVNE